MENGIDLNIFSDGGTGYSLSHAILVFKNPQNYSARVRTLVYKYLYQHSVKAPQHCPSDVEVLDAIEDYFHELFNTGQDQEYMNELVDIALNYDRTRGLVMLNQLRQREGDDDDINDSRIHLRPSPPVPAPSSNYLVKVLRNSQNVHNTNINKNVLRAATNLVKIYKSNDSPFKHYFDKLRLKDIQNELCRSHPLKIIPIRHVIDRIKYENFTFGIGITLKDVLKSLWLLIKFKRSQKRGRKIKKKKRSWKQMLLHFIWPTSNKFDLEETDKEWQHDFKKRLVEEICSAKGYCSTGHLARLINSMQGFVDDKGLQVYMEDKKYGETVVRHFLTESLKNCKDEKVIDGMVDGKQEYIEFIREKITEKLFVWKEEGRPWIGDINDIVNTYCGIQVF